MNMLLFSISSVAVLTDFAALFQSYNTRITRITPDKNLSTLILIFGTVFLSFIIGLVLLKVVAVFLSMPTNTGLFFLFMLGFKIAVRSRKTSFVEFEESNSIKVVFNQALLASVNIFIFGLVWGIMSEKPMREMLVFFTLLCVYTVILIFVNKNFNLLYTKGFRLIMGILIMGLSSIELMRLYF